MNRRRALWLVAAVAMVGAVCGCGVSDRMGSPSAGMREAQSDVQSKAAMPTAGGLAPQANGAEGRAPLETKAPSLGTVAGSQEPDRYLIKNGVLTLEVKNARIAAEMLLASVRSSKGYMANLQETVDALGARSVTAQVRVPAASFEPSLRSIEALGKVLSKNVTAEDVTEEYVDSQSRLRNLQRTEERLLSHLSKTGKLSDTLLIERELARVREEIEKLQGRLRFLSHRVAFCTFDVTMSEAARQQALTNPQTFSSGKVFSDAVRSLVDFAQSVWSLIIWMAIWAPVWLPLALVGLWLYRRALRLALGKGRQTPR